MGTLRDPVKIYNEEVCLPHRAAGQDGNNKCWVELPTQDLWVTAKHTQKASLCHKNFFQDVKLLCTDTQTDTTGILCVAILILQLESEDAILQPPFAPRFPDKPSQRRGAKHSAGSAESRHLTRDVNALKKPPCTLSRWFFHGLVVLSSLFSPALDRCQRHSNVSGCVTVLSRRHFVDESVQASSFSFLQDWWSAAHTLSGGRLFLGSPALIVFWVI